MKKAIRKIATAVLCITTIYASAQDPKPTIAVIAIDCNGFENDSASLAYMMRLELEKTKVYNVMDKYDVTEMIKKNQIDIRGCYGKSCVVSVGKQLNVDKMLTGSVER